MGKKMNSLTKKLDAEWSRVVKQKAGNQCEVCGAIMQLNSHHIVGRENYRLRWDTRNGVCLCVSHHKFGKESAHMHPIWFDEWLKENRAEDREYVNRVAMEIKKWTEDEKLDKLAFLRAI